MYSLYVDMSGLVDAYSLYNRFIVHHLRESPDLKQRPSGVDDKLRKAVDYEKLQGTQRFLTMKSYFTLTLHCRSSNVISNTILV